jgi:hypothetical protein
MFKKEYDDMLVKLHVKDIFTRNFLQLNGDYESLNESEDFNDFILCGFPWDETPEGLEFWDNIANS